MDKIIHTVDETEIKELIAGEYGVSSSKVQLKASFGDPQYPYSKPDIYAEVEIHDLEMIRRRLINGINATCKRTLRRTHGWT